MLEDPSGSIFSQHVYIFFSPPRGTLNLHTRTQRQRSDRLLICMVSTFRQSMGVIANPSRGQLKKENMFFLRPCSRLRIWSRLTTSAVPSRVSLLILHIQAESGAYPRDSSRFRRRRPHIPSTAIGSIPILSSHANAYRVRWHSLPRVYWHSSAAGDGLTNIMENHPFVPRARSSQTASTQKEVGTAVSL